MSDVFFLLEPSQRFVLLSLLIFRYAVMKKCWVKDADDRPGINTIARDLKRLVRVDSEPPVSLNI